MEVGEWMTARATFGEPLLSLPGDEVVGECFGIGDELGEIGDFGELLEDGKSMSRGNACDVGVPGAGGLDTVVASIRCAFLIDPLCAKLSALSIKCSPAEPPNAPDWSAEATIIVVVRPVSKVPYGEMWIGSSLVLYNYPSPPACPPGKLVAGI
jgi:hypothetical protein